MSINSPLCSADGSSCRVGLGNSPFSSLSECWWGHSEETQVPFRKIFVTKKPLSGNIWYSNSILQLSQRCSAAQQMSSNFHEMAPIDSEYPWGGLGGISGLLPHWLSFIPTQWLVVVDKRTFLCTSALFWAQGDVVEQQENKGCPYLWLVVLYF